MARFPRSGWRRPETSDRLCVRLGHQAYPPGRTPFVTESEHRHHYVSESGPLIRPALLLADANCTPARPQPCRLLLTPEKPFRAGRSAMAAPTANRLLLIHFFQVYAVLPRICGLIFLFAGMTVGLRTTLAGNRWGDFQQ